MNNTSKPSYINGSFGKIKVNTFNDGAVLTQEKNGVITGSIALGPEDMEKLAKALFAEKNKAFPKASPKFSAIPLPKVKVPSLPDSGATSGNNHMEDLKAKHKNAYTPWTPEEEKKLKQYHSEGKTTPEIANLLGRNDGAITSRKAKLGLS